MKKILIVGAHYDDAELGAGASAARFVSEGKEVYKVTLTDTEVISKDMDLNITPDRVRDNSRCACDILGVKEVYLTQSKYGQLEYSQNIMQEIEHEIISREIDTCIFHFDADYNTDHLAASKICKTASRHCQNILMFQSNPYIISEAFYPNFFIDVTNYIELKRQALSCYDSEHNRQGNLFETNIERNKIWGYGNHVKYAEGFVAIKMCI